MMRKLVGVAVGVLCCLVIGLCSCRESGLVGMKFFGLPPVIGVTSALTDRVDDVEHVEEPFLEFQEIDQATFLQVIREEPVKHIGKAGQEIYLQLEDGSGLWYLDEDGSMAAYASFLGLEPVSLSASGFRDQREGNAWWKGVMVFGVLLLISALACRYLVMKTQTHAVSVSVPVETSAPVRKKDVPVVHLSDVEGVDGLKQDIMRIVDCLKNPSKYAQAGARPPKGVILYGPPGTGKTLLAKAIAGEAGVPFLSMVGSDFVEKYVGTGAKRVRELYASARKAAPCIVFIDEIDAVASRRGRDENSERDQTINALLAELDGFSSSAGIVTICATNRLELLDDAFKRAGRFDLKLAVGLPDLMAREHILAIHAKNKQFESEDLLPAMARKCVGFSGADLEALLNEAAMLAAGDGRSMIGASDLNDAFFKIVMQGNKLSRKQTDEIMKMIAWHESGHTLAAKLLTEDTVSTVTIVGFSSGAGGCTFRVPKQEGFQNKKYLRASICVLYAGRAAEQLLTGDADLVTTGASQDIKQATGLIRDYLASYGMGGVGLLDLSQLRRDYEDIVEEASSLSKELYEETLQFLMEHRKTLQTLSEALLEQETLNESQIDEILLQTA